MRRSIVLPSALVLVFGFALTGIFAPRLAAQDATPAPAVTQVELTPGFIAEVFTSAPSDRASGQTVYIARFTIEPGSDIALLNAIARVVVQRRWHDIGFIGERTEGQTFEAYQRSSLGADIPHDEFLAAFEQYHPDLATPEHLDSPAVLGYWAAAKLLVAALEAQGERITKDGINAWIQGVENFEVGITPPIISMAPDCKTGSEIVWIAPWEWDDAAGKATRRPATGYFTSPQKEDFGGRCFLTAISDDIGK